MAERRNVQIRLKKVIAFHDGSIDFSKEMKRSKRYPVGEISGRERSTPIGSGYHDFQDSFSERFNASSWDICLFLDY